MILTYPETRQAILEALARGLTPLVTEAPRLAAGGHDEAPALSSEVDQLPADHDNPTGET